MTFLCGSIEVADAFDSDDELRFSITYGNSTYLPRAVVRSLRDHLSAVLGDAGASGLSIEEIRHAAERTAGHIRYSNDSPAAARTAEAFDRFARELSG